MANVGDVQVRIGLDTTDVQNGAKNVERNLNDLNNKFRQLGEASSRLAERLRQVYEKQRQAMLPFKQEQIEVQNKFLDLAMSADKFAGSTDKFMEELQKLGKEQKRITDEMMKRNELMKISFIQSVGAMLARSGQSEKIAQNFDRMGNPLYKVNKGALQVTKGLEGIARAGLPAVTALRMLGPTANMKDLHDQIILINQGLTRFQAVALASAVTSVLFYGALHKAAMKSNKEYAASFNTMVKTLREAVQPLVDVFAMVMTPVYNFITAIAKMVIEFNKAHPTIAKFIAGIVLLVPILTLLLSPLAIGIGLVNGMMVAFSSIWRIIAPLVTGLASMSATVWLVAGAIVGLVAVGILLYKNWDSIVAWLKNTWSSLKAKAVEIWEGIKNYLSTTWTSIKTKVSEVFGSIANWFAEKWNAVKTKTVEIFNSIVAFIVKWGKMLILASPIGLFVKFIVTNWNTIKTTTKIIFEMIVAIIRAIFLKIVQVVSPIVKSVWNTIKSAWNSVKTTTSTVFNAVKSVLLSVWRSIVNFVKPIVTSIWNAVRSAWNNVKSTTSSIFNSVKATVSSVWNSIKSKVVSVASSIWSTVKSKFSAMKSAMTAPIESAKDTIRGALNKIKSFFSGLKLKIPKPQLPHISVSKAYKEFLGQKIPYPKFSVTWNAKGNIFTKPTLLGGGQGVGEAGAEVVMPIERKRYMKPYASMVASLLPDFQDNESKGSITNHFNISQLIVREEADIQRIAYELERMQRKQQRAKGVFAY
jgi:phage-related protein